MDSSDPFNIVLAESSIAMQMLSTGLFHSLIQFLSFLVESGDFLRNELTQRGQEEGRSFLRNAFDVGLKVAQEETLASHRYESILSLTYKIEKVEKGGKFELLVPLYPHHLFLTSLVLVPYRWSADALRDS